jgi:nucleotide-binding universal stress UspA family protein
LTRIKTTPVQQRRARLAGVQSKRDERGKNGEVMKRPLVPIDGSEDALRAFAHALGELRGQPAAELHVLNVQTPPIHPWPGKLVSPDVIAAELRHAGEAIVAATERPAAVAGVACAGHVRIGHAAAEIAECARELGCDAIVMGTRGLGRVANIVLGSVAHKVVHLADVPVTLVR